MIRVKKMKPHSIVTSSDQYLDPIEAVLAEAPCTVVGQMVGAKHNSTKEVTFEDGTVGVFHTPTRRGLRKGNIPPSSAYKRDRLTYLVSKILGLDIVPPVVIRKIDEVLGSVMLFVNGETWSESDLTYSDVDVLEWQRLAILDWLVCHTDRHRRNWLVDDQFWAIDNDLTFPEKREYGEFQGYRSTPHQYLSDAGDRGIPLELMRLFTSAKKEEILWQMLRYGLPQGAQDIFIHRWDYIDMYHALPVYEESTNGFMKELQYEEVATA
jgi:hypothetical protein